jgi:hypothetical protein
MMIKYLKKIVIQNIVSPIGLAMVSYLIFLFAWLFPPGLYTSYIHEPDLMFLDPLCLAFYTSCVVAFVLGVRASRITGGAVRKQPVAIIVVRNPFLYLGVPIFLGLVCCVIYLILLGGKLDFVALLVSQQGGAIKTAAHLVNLDIEGWSSGLFMLTGALWWSAFRANQVHFTSLAKYAFRLLFVLGVIVDLVTCVATVDRTNLMPLIAGLSVIFLFGKAYSTKIQVLKLAVIGMSSAGGVVATFFLVSFLRGAIAVRDLVMLLIGYTIVSYNRMAALLLGVMHDTYEGRGAYLFYILSQNETLNNMFHFRDRFNWPTTYGLWSGEFSTIASAGLNPGFNYYSTFGALYSDLGWMTPAYVLAIGFLSGYMWTRFRAGKTLALVLYPWCAFWILFWTGFNIIFDNRIIGFVKVVLVLTIYDKFMLRGTQEHEDTLSGPDHRLTLLEPVSTTLGRGLF